MSIDWLGGGGALRRWRGTGKADDAAAVEETAGKAGNLAFILAGVVVFFFIYMFRIRFCWANPPVQGGHWRGGLVNTKRPTTSGKDGKVVQDPDHAIWRAHRSHALHLSFRGLLIWLLAVLLTGYMAGAGVGVAYLEKQNPHNRVTYLDLVWPGRWKNLEKLRGEALIARGEELLKLGHFNGGFALLRAGLARHPADHATRLKIAKIYVAMRLRIQAEQLLRAGFEHGYPGRDYVGFALLLATDAGRDAERSALCELARAGLAAEAPGTFPAGEARWLDEQTVEAWRAAGRHAEAEAWVEARYGEADPFRRETVALAMLETGRAAEAVAFVSRWVGEAPREVVALRLLIRACRSAGDHAGLDAALARLRALTPARAQPLVVAVGAQYLAARPEAARAALDELLFRHGADTELFFDLSNVLADLGYSEGLDRLDAEARERGLTLLPMVWGRFQLSANRRDWPAILNEAAKLAETPGPEFPPAHVRYQETVVRLARACLDGATGTQSALVEIVADHPPVLSLYRLIIESLLDAGRATTAHRILTLAEGAFANSEVIVALRGRIESRLAAREAADTHLGTGAGVMPGTAKDGDGDGRFETMAAAMDEIARLSAAKDEARALAVVVAVRRARPGWLAAAEPALERSELWLRARDEDPLRLQLLVRATLPRSVDAAEALLGLAREIHAEGRVENAILITRELIRHDPGQAEALAQLANWQAPVAEETGAPGGVGAGAGVGERR